MTRGGGVPLPERLLVVPQPSVFDRRRLGGPQADGPVPGGRPASGRHAEPGEDEERRRTSGDLSRIYDEAVEVTGLPELK